MKLLITTVLFLVALELCARIDDAVRYDAPFWNEYSADILHVDDKDGFRRNVRLARFEKWQNNRYGFRGPDFLPEKTPGVLRIVCLGSSETYGYLESPGKEWPAQLQGLLPSDKFQVINAAVVGTSLPSFDPYLKKVVLPLNPDVVVLVVPPLFYFNFSRSSTTLAAKRSNLGSSNNNGPASTPLATKILAHVRCFPKVKQVVKQAIQGSFPERFHDNQLRDLTRQVRELERSKLAGKKPFDSIPKQFLSQYHDELFALVTMLQSHGVNVLLTSYPSLLSAQNRGEIPEIVLGLRKFCIGLSSDGLLDGYERFNAVNPLVASESNALFIDCARQLPKTEEFFGDGVHYTDLGARRMAEIVAAALIGHVHDLPPNPGTGRAAKLAENP